MIQIEHLNKVFGEGTDNPHHVLHDIDLTVNDGDVFGIIGSSGAGKSTLVRCINLLERPTSGRILIDGQDVSGYTGKKLLDLRSSIGMIFQSFNLMPSRTVIGNVLLDLVGLADKEGHYPVQLSGGQQQRVAIARALANNPKIMLCDEATSALDTRTTVGVLELLGNINKELGVTMIMITHSLAVAQKACNRIAVIDAGRIVEEGPTKSVFQNPQSSVTKALLEYDSIVASSEADDAAKEA